jgi:phage tail-like protein
MSMNTINVITRHAILRAGEAWPGVDLDGLVAAPNGDLALRRIPAVSSPVRQAHLKQSAGPSGIATDRACGLYLADTAGNRVIRVALDCHDRHDRQVLPGQANGSQAGTFHAPAGLVVGPFGWLYVADSGSGRVVVVTTPVLSVRDAWAGGLASPTGIAADSDLGVLVLDAGIGKVRRFDPFGRPDPAFDSALAANGPADPRAIAVDDAGLLYVADAATGSILVFDRAGQPVAPPLAPGIQCDALAVVDSVLYMSDAVSGHVTLLSLPDGQHLGTVVGYRGPVTALAIDGDGNLYIKPDLGADWVTARAKAAFIVSGFLQPNEPLDAGEGSSWLRVKVTATPGKGGEVSAATFSSDQPSGPPHWTKAAATTTLVPPGRYLWLRVSATTRDQTSSPIVLDVEAESSGDSFLTYLPAVYERDQSADFLSRFLELARAELGGLEAVIAALPRLFDPATAPAAWLDWLASWQAFEVPASLANGRRPEALRALLARLPQLYARRGTPAGLADAVEIYAGARPHVFENFRTCGVWVLNETSTLGFDTMLAAASPDGLVVGEAVVGESRPEPVGAWAQDLFTDAAHRFTVVLPTAAAGAAATRRVAQRVLDAAKPAHTTYHLCLPGPSLQVGTQARLGIDAIVAGPGPGLVLDEHASLGLDARLGDVPPSSPGTVAERGHVGVSTRLG